MFDSLSLLPPLLQGLTVTLQVTAGAILVAIPMALLAGVGRLARWRMVSWPAVAYIEVFRGTVGMVQRFWFYCVLPLFGVSLPAIAAGILVLGLKSGAYGAEVVRGAIQAVPKGQREAALALNMTPGHSLRRIILPQA